MIIVSGKIYDRPGAREGFLALSPEAIMQARRSSGCHDFVVATDPIEADRVNVYEEWESEEALTAFRGEGPGQDFLSEIIRAQVTRHVVLSSGPP
jgi:quinol monooxygenase YgiN